MDQPLRCNNQVGGYCRSALVDEAVVTTCSHIFCIPCAEKVGLSNAPVTQRSCPTCQTVLPKPDDAVKTRLVPSEDYKTSVLSGLDPTTIMECAGRALSFWTYQTTQEIYFQEHFGKKLTDRCGQLNTAMDKVINEANAEIQNLQSKIAGLTMDQKSLQKKNAELIDTCREKSRKHAQTQQLYDALKKRVMMNQAHAAASENATQTLQSLSKIIRPQTYDMTPIERPANSGYTRAEPLTTMEHSTRIDRGNEMQSHNQYRGENADYNLRGNAITPHRTATEANPSAANRSTFNRSQIPLSNSRAHLTSSNNKQPTQTNDHSFRHQIQVDKNGCVNRNSGSTPRSHSARSEGMKFERAAGLTGSHKAAPKLNLTGDHFNMSEQYSHRFGHA